MTIHHLVKESDIKENCIYCGKNLINKKWESKFEGDFHYKTIICECGREIITKVDFLGSGHDSWDGTYSWEFVVDSYDEKLEVKIKKLQRFQEIKRVDGFKK